MGGFRRDGVVLPALLAVLSLGASPVAAASRWTRVASPSIKGKATILSAVSCVRTDWCVAVGAASDPQGSAAVIEHWDGAAWSLMSVPSAGAWSELAGVTCSADDDCVAVGGSRAGTLVERWNGSTWSVVPSPNQDADDALNAVACSTPTSCFAVGSGDAPRTSKPTAVLEQWDGVQWTVVPSLLPRIASELLGVTCPASNTCLAVGRQYGGHRRTVTLTEVWNGAWSIVKSPNITTSKDRATNSLNGVACSSSADCTAVGFLDDGTTSTPLAERWNGTKWRLATTPAVAGVTGFNAIDCTANVCAAVGYSHLDLDGSSTLVETTQGSDFDVVPSASPGTGYNFLNGVACVGAGTCIAVGERADEVSPPPERSLVLVS